jgi:hypothetical protein
LFHEIKENEMGGTSVMYGVRIEMHTGFGLENLKKRNHLKDLNLDGGIIL